MFRPRSSCIWVRGGRGSDKDIAFWYISRSYLTTVLALPISIADVCMVLMKRGLLLKKQKKLGKYQLGIFFYLDLMLHVFFNPWNLEFSPSLVASGQSIGSREEVSSRSPPARCCCLMRSPSPRTTSLHSDKHCTRTIGAFMWSRRAWWRALLIPNSSTRSRSWRP